MKCSSLTDVYIFYLENLSLVRWLEAEYYQFHDLDNLLDKTMSI